MAARIYDLAEATHGWSLQQIEAAPRALTDRLLDVHRATQRARRMTHDEYIDLLAGQVRAKQDREGGQWQVSPSP